MYELTKSHYIQAQIVITSVLRDYLGSKVILSGITIRGMGHGKIVSKTRLSVF